jgi:hypothetical protein
MIFSPSAKEWFEKICAYISQNYLAFYADYVEILGLWWRSDYSRGLIHPTQQQYFDAAVKHGHSGMNSNAGPKHP